MNDPKDLPAGITTQDVAEMQRVIARCWIVAGLIIGLPLEELDQLTGRADTEGPALYPDIWRANAAKILQDREMVRTLVAARRELLTVSPAHESAITFAERAATEKRAMLAAAFRDVFSRRELADVSPLTVLSGLVRWVAFRAPTIIAKRGNESRER